MRATYATLAQEAGVADSIINAMQGRAKNSQILYRHYESPMVSAYQRAAESYAGLLGVHDAGRPDGRGRTPA
jgi:intergrase/recombinase